MMLSVLSHTLGFFLVATDPITILLLPFLALVFGIVSFVGWYVGKENLFCSHFAHVRSCIN